MWLHSYIVYYLSGSQFMCMTDTDDVLCVCADVVPCLSGGYKQWRGRVEGIDPPTHGRWSTLTSLRHDIENLLYGVTNDGWQ